MDVNKLNYIKLILNIKIIIIKLVLLDFIDANIDKLIRSKSTCNTNPKIFLIVFAKWFN